MKNVDIDDKAFSKIEAIIYSMTPQERQNPAIINGSRRRRIASGSGSDIQDVNQLIKQFDETRSLMRQMTVGKGIGNVMKKMTGSKKKKKK